MQVRVRPPPVPVIVIVWNPVGVPELVTIVSVELKLGVPEDELKEADRSPEADRLTVLLNPAIEETETVAVVKPPRTTEPEVGLTPMEKSGVGGGGTTAVTVRV